MYKGGVSGIVTAVLVVLIAIVAAGILWVGINTFLEDSEDHSQDTNCLATTLHVVSCSINQTSNITTVSVSRQSGNAELQALNFIFYNSGPSIKLSRNNSLPGELEIATFSFTATNILSSKRVDIGAVIGGQTCQLTGTPVDCTQRDNNRPITGQNNTGDLPECSDGVDNDGDSWTDEQDSDCYTNNIYDENNTEQWFALSTCSDGIDNNANGLIDSADTSCQYFGQSGHESTMVLTGGPGSEPTECSDGVDNDGDALIDYPLEPGCAGFGDDNEGDEARTSNIQFAFGGDGYIRELNWTNSTGSTKRVILDEKNGRYGGGGVRFYSHMTWPNDYGGLSWSYKLPNGQLYYASNQSGAIAYSKLSQSSDEVVVQARDANIVVKDTFRFYQDTMFIVINVSNNLNGPITQISIPLYLGGLMIGNYNTSATPQVFDSNISRLFPGAGGTIESNFTSNGGVIYEYPSLNGFSPVNVIWDSKITVGEQLLTEISPPDSWTFFDKSRQQFSPAIVSQIHFDLQAHESRVFTLAIKISDGGKWQQSLDPYKSWFYAQHGSATPFYCPIGPFVNLVGLNNQDFNPRAWNFTANRYMPGLGIGQIFRTQTASSLQTMGITEYGIWQSTLYSGCLIGNGDCSRDSIPECLALNNGDNCEFSANTELIDPNLDAGPNRTKINDFANSFAQKNVNLFWYMRPCADIYGANVTYNPDGSYSFVSGTPTEYANVDLRNISNRDRQFGRIDDLASRGINGFYFDAAGCPGDEAFYEFTRQQLKAKYNKDFFLSAEGARDRVGLIVGQMPLYKLPDYSYNSTQLITYLTPQTTFFGGAFNSPLSVNPPEVFDAVNRGAQAIVYNSPLTLSELSTQTWSGVPMSQVWCRLINQSYTNRYMLWQQYGNAMGCPQPPQHPSWYPNCPV